MVVVATTETWFNIYIYIYIYISIYIYIFKMIVQYVLLEQSVDK